jgi:hypothetical protein
MARNLLYSAARSTIPHTGRCPMNTIDRRIAELHDELRVLRLALEIMGTSLDRDRIFERINLCIAEYTELVNRRMSAIIATDQPLIEQGVGEDMGRTHQRPIMAIGARLSPLWHAKAPVILGRGFAVTRCVPLSEARRVFSGQLGALYLRGTPQISRPGGRWHPARP